MRRLYVSGVVLCALLCACSNGAGVPQPTIAPAAQPPSAEPVAVAGRCTDVPPASAVPMLTPSEDEPAAEDEHPQDQSPTDTIGEATMPLSYDARANTIAL